MWRNEEILLVVAITHALFSCHQWMLFWGSWRLLFSMVVGYLWNFKLMLMWQFGEDWCKHTHSWGKHVHKHISSHVRAFMAHACVYMHKSSPTFCGIYYGHKSLSLKSYKDQSVCYRYMDSYVVLKFMVESAISFFVGFS